MASLRSHHSGTDFSGGLPARVLPALAELQRAFHRSYARSLYGDEGNRLSREERRETELIIQLGEGSTKISADLTSALNSMARKMSGSQSARAILALALLYCGDSSLKAYFDDQASERSYDLQIRLSEEETKRQEALMRLVSEVSDVSAQQLDVISRQLDVISQQRRDVENAHNHLFRALDDNDRLVFDDDVEVSGYDARRFARQPSGPRVATRIEGEFAILSVRSGGVAKGFRARIRDVITRRSLSVAIHEGGLPEEQIRRLRQAEWAKTTVHLQVDVERVGDKIASATVAEVRSPSALTAVIGDDPEEDV